MSESILTTPESETLPVASPSEANWPQLDTDFVWHPYTQMKLSPVAVPVLSAKGSYLLLKDGRRVFDAISSWWLTLHGHARPEIALAIAEQAAKLEQVIFAGFTHEPAARLAARLVERAPEGLTKVFFSDDGSTAVEVALKMTLQYWLHLGEPQRRTFLVIEDAYHGDTFGAMSVSERGAFTAAFTTHLFDVVRLPFPAPPEGEQSAFSEAELQFLAALERNCRQNSEVAGFIYEPLLLGSGGMRVWRPSVLERAIAIVHEAGLIAIADEVLTGFGRTGTMWASDRCSAKPDIMTLSKGLTGGFLPMGVTLASERLYQAFLSDDRRKTFFHGHSYTGNPIACAAGLASLEIFDKEPVLEERIPAIEQVHRERMMRLAGKRDDRVRILGTMAAMQPRASEGYLSRTSLTLSARALERELLLRPLGDVIYFLPPYSTTADVLHRAYDILETLLS